HVLSPRPGRGASGPQRHRRASPNRDVVQRRLPDGDGLSRQRQGRGVDGRQGGGRDGHAFERGRVLPRRDPLSRPMARDRWGLRRTFRTPPGRSAVSWRWEVGLPLFVMGFLTAVIVGYANGANLLFWVAAVLAGI